MWLILTYIYMYRTSYAHFCSSQQIIFFSETGGAIAVELLQNYGFTNDRDSRTMSYNQNSPTKQSALI